MPHLTAHWEHFQGNPNPAIRQPKYLGRGQHIDEARHIDCGLYAYFNTLQTVSNGSSYGFTPEGIHYSRLALAHQLTGPVGLQPISFWLPNQDPVSLLNSQVTVSSTESQILSDPPPPLQQNQHTGVPSVRIRTLLPRAVKKISSPERTIPLPPGRVVQNIMTNDKAQTHTYAARSTLNDIDKGIDAGLGLFARRLHGPSSKLDDGHLVGYYLGTQLTRNELEELRRNPQGRMLGFILDFQGLIVDGYDHLRDRYHSMPVLMNDFCDDHGNNTEAVIETITINSKRTDVIAIYANRDVVAHEEFGYAYGHTGLCDASLPLQVLFKAARYYHKQIMQDETRIWWVCFRHNTCSIVLIIVLGH